MPKTDFPPSWPWANDLLKTFEKSELFVVGGAVRDWLLNRPVKDYDLVARGVSIDELLQFLQTKGDVNLVGKRFGVIKFRPHNEKNTIDIALPRREYSRNFTGGYRDFDIQSDPHMPIEEDLARRDFTINAMAYNVRTSSIVDPFFGQKDLQRKTIRTVGAAVTRFQEDYSRMLRAIRFACQLRFDISETTTNAIKKMAYHLNDRSDEHWVVSREIIGQEFVKAYDADPVRCLQLCDELGVLEIILPEIKRMQTTKQTPPYHLEGTAYDHLILALKTTQTPAYKQWFPEPLPLFSKIAILFHDIGKPLTLTEKKGVAHFYGHDEVGSKLAGEVARRLHIDQAEDLVWLVKHHLFAIAYQDKKIPATLLEEMFFSRRPGQSLLHCTLADLTASVTTDPNHLAPFEKLMREIKELAPDGVLPPPLISGSDVIEWCHLKAGPEISEILKDVREQQLTGAIKDRANARSYLEQTYGTAGNPRASRGKK